MCRLAKSECVDTAKEFHGFSELTICPNRTGLCTIAANYIEPTAQLFFNRNNSYGNRFSSYVLDSPDHRWAF